MSSSPCGLTPLISVFDMPSSVRFYCEMLGFEIVSASPTVTTREGTFSHWMWLRLGNAGLMLNTQFDSDERPDNPDPERIAAHGDTVFYVAVPDIDEAYAVLIGRGLHADPPMMAPYGLRQFGANDPDGYTIVFQETPGI